MIINKISKNIKYYREKILIKRISILIKTIILFVMFLNIFVFTNKNENTIYASEDDLFKADIPIFYGEKQFLDRIEKIRKEKEDHKILALHLSGGSARAFAHIGVLKRLEEEGIKPDVIIANSMGSIIGLMYAAGIPVEIIEEIFKNMNLGNLFNPVFPKDGGILDVSNFIAILHSLIGDKDISQLNIPVIVVCEDLKSKRKVFLTKGDFYKVLKAAFALPVYFSPQEIDNFLLIDGGITNLVPLENIANLFDINVVATTFYNKNLNLKNPLTIVNVGFDIGKRRQGVKNIKKFTPFLIRCDVEKFSFMDWDKIDEIINRGYLSTDKIIVKLKEYLKTKKYNFKLKDKKLKKNDWEYNKNSFKDKWRITKYKIIEDYYFKKNEKSFNISFSYSNYEKYFEKHNLLKDKFFAINFKYYNLNYQILFGPTVSVNKNYGLYFNFNYNPFGYLHFNFESFLYSSNLFENNFNFITYYLYQELFLQKFYFNRLMVKPFLSFEYLNGNIFYTLGFDNSYSNFNIDSIIKTGLELSLFFSKGEVNLFQNKKNYIKIKSNYFLENKANGFENEIVLNSRVNSFCDFSIRVMNKNLINNNNLYFSYRNNDYFYGLNESFNTDKLLILNLDSSFNLNRINFTFGETFIFNNFSFLAFTHLILFDESNFNLIELNNYLNNLYNKDINLYLEYFNTWTFTSGIGIKFNISLIGLKPFKVNLLLGVFPKTMKLFYIFYIN